MISDVKVNGSTGYTMQILAWAFGFSKVIAPMDAQKKFFEKNAHEKNQDVENRFRENMQKNSKIVKKRCKKPIFYYNQ